MVYDNQFVRNLKLDADFLLQIVWHIEPWYPEQCSTQNEILCLCTQQTVPWSSRKHMCWFLHRTGFRLDELQHLVQLLFFRSLWSTCNALCHVNNCNWIDTLHWYSRTLENIFLGMQGTSNFSSHWSWHKTWRYTISLLLLCHGQSSVVSLAFAWNYGHQLWGQNLI